MNRYRLIACIDLIVDGDLFKMLLIVHRRSDNLVWIRNRTEKHLVGQRESGAVRRDGPNLLHDAIQIRDHDIMGWQRVTIMWQDLQRSCHITNAGAFYKSEPIVSKSTKSHFEIIGERDGDLAADCA